LNIKTEIYCSDSRRMSYCFSASPKGQRLLSLITNERNLSLLLSTDSASLMRSKFWRTGEAVASKGASIAQHLSGLCTRPAFAPGGAAQHHIGWNVERLLQMSLLGR